MPDYEIMDPDNAIRNNHPGFKGGYVIVMSYDDDTFSVTGPMPLEKAEFGAIAMEAVRPDETRRIRIAPLVEVDLPEEA